MKHTKLALKYVGYPFDGHGAEDATLTIDRTRRTFLSEKWGDAALLIHVPKDMLRYCHRWHFNEAGQCEYDILLTDKPRSNVFQWPIESHNLVFDFQRKLTPWELARGNSRPANVVGSYALYHGWKRDNQYKTGKFCHVYRPMAMDANGSRCWGRLRFDAGWMTIVWPERWLANAKYPVVLDPTIGYTSIGASTDVTEDFALMVQVSTSTAGDANPGTAFYGGHGNGSSVTGYVGAYVYNASGPYSQTRLAVSSAITVTTTTNTFKSAAITWTGIASGTDYFLGTWADDFNNRCYYDSGSGNGFYNKLNTSIPTDPFPSAGGGGNSGDFDNRLSCYVDYTASGGGTKAPPLSRRSQRFFKRVG